MGCFTDSPYEYMMMEKPAGKVGNPQRAGGISYPVGHKCRGCPYGRERPCMGICIKELGSHKRRKEK